MRRCGPSRTDRQFLCDMNPQNTSAHLSNVTEVYIPVTFGDNTNVIEESRGKAEEIKKGMVH